LKDEYLEDDFGATILPELEIFILEIGLGFAFVERQKRMLIDGRANHLDLLFYNRYLKRLVSVELKLGSFVASPKEQM
jgi:predicted nuclease of restriction endonuclease-like (RecB) superfamily